MQYIYSESKSIEASIQAIFQLEWGFASGRNLTQAELTLEPVCSGGTQTEEYA